MTPPTCSSISLARGETLAGTASTVKRWLLLEDPGPWGPDAVTQNGLPASLTTDVAKWGKATRTRIVLIRRGPRRTGSGRAFLAESDPDNQWLSAFSFGDIARVLECNSIDEARGAVRGEEQENLFLVCTHGRHDRCCSIEGNPVSRALTATHAERTWDCSHIGGDRFAANLVCLPYGAYFGRITPGSVVEVADAFIDGRIDLRYFRGRSAWPFPVQAADVEVRGRLHLFGLEAVIATGWRVLDDSHVSVDLSVEGDEDLEVIVQRRESEEQYLLTCDSLRPRHATYFVAVSVASRQQRSN